MIGREIQAAPKASVSDIKMETRFVGSSGLKVSEIGLGPYSCIMSDPMQDTKKQELFCDICDSYVNLGGNYIDIADVYVGAEYMTGLWLNKQTINRDNVIIGSKVGLHTVQNDRANGLGLSRKHICRSIEKSLKDLQTDYLDIYFAHVWDKGTPVKEWMSTMNDLVRSGKIRYIGLSNFSAWQTQKAVDVANFMGQEPIVVLQTQYNLIERHAEYDQMDVCRNEGLGIFSWGPLSAGWLGGQYRRGLSTAPKGSRMSTEVHKGSLQAVYNNQYAFKDNDRTWNIIEELGKISGETGKTIPQLAINWAKDSPGISTTLIGPKSVDQLLENMGACTFSMSPEHRHRLDTVSRLHPLATYSLQMELNPRDMRSH